MREDLRSFSSALALRSFSAFADPWGSAGAKDDWRGGIWGKDKDAWGKEYSKHKTEWPGEQKRGPRPAAEVKRGAQHQNFG